MRRSCSYTCGRRSSSASRSPSRQRRSSCVSSLEFGSASIVGENLGRVARLSKYEARIEATTVRRRGPDMMTMQSELANIGRYYASLDAALRDPSRVAEEDLFAPDCVEHCADGDRAGAEVIAWLATRRVRYPAAVWTIELL